MLKHVNSEIVILGAQYFHCLKLLFDSEHILQNMKIDIAGKHFLSGSKMEKTTNLSQNCPKIAIRNFCNVDCRYLKQKRL